jgi:hypothetical protein
MGKKTVADQTRGGRSGPRAPAGKKPLLVVINEDTIKAAKIAAILDGKKVSGIVEELLQGWLSSREGDAIEKRAKPAAATTSSKARRR